MDPDEAQICEYLKACPGQFVSAREVCRRAGGKWRYREDERWAYPVLRRMIEEELIETDGTGHYRLITRNEEKKIEKKWWIAPQIKRILRESGRNLAVIDVEADLDPEDTTLIKTYPGTTLFQKSDEIEGGRSKDSAVPTPHP